jgi:hypothetical protein
MELQFLTLMSKYLGFGKADLRMIVKPMFSMKMEMIKGCISRKLSTTCFDN